MKKENACEPITMMGISTKRDVTIRGRQKKTERKEACHVPLPLVLVCRCQLKEGGIHVERQMGVGGQGEAKTQ